MAEPNTNNLVTTTILDYHKTFADNVSNSNAVLALMKKNGRKRTVEGGRAIACPLTYAEETYVWYTGSELLSRALKETISESDWAPANSAASITLTGPDLAKNKGRAAILSLLEGKMDNCQVTMNNNITKAVYGDGSVAKSFPGLKAIVTDNGAGQIGGIDSGTWTFWKNQFATVARATGLQYAALKAAMNAMWLKLVRGSEKPDLILADAEFYGTYESGLQENQRYADASLGALGFETLKYKTAAIAFDAAATGLVGEYFLNTKYLKFEVYSGRDFEMLDLPDKSPDMDAITRHIGFMGAMTCSNRSMQGRLTATGT